MALFHHFMVLKFKSERSLLPMVNDQASASGSHDQRASPLAQAVWPGTQPGFLVHFHSQCEVPALLVTHKASGWVCVCTSMCLWDILYRVASPIDKSLITLNFIFSVSIQKPRIELLAFPYSWNWVTFHWSILLENIVVLNVTLKLLSGFMLAYLSFPYLIQINPYELRQFISSLGNGISLHHP